MVKLMSTNHAVLSLSVSVAFLTGVLLTLLSTGAVRVHWGAHPGSSDTVAVQDIRPPEQVETAPPVRLEQQPSAVNAALAKYDLNNINPEDFLVVPVGTPPEEAREQMLAEFSKAPGITFGEGYKDIYILFDPLCPHCHNFFRRLEASAHAEYGLKSHWIPAVVFQDNPNSLLFSQRLTEAVQSGDSDKAKAAYRSLANGNPVPLQEQSWIVTPEAAMRVARNTVGLMQIIGGQKGAGTPVVIYRNTKGEVEIVTGELLNSDFPNIGKVDAS